MCYTKKAKHKVFLNSSAVEHSAVNRTVAGSNPAWGVFLWLVGQVVKTRPFHGCNRGSNPLRVIFWRHSQAVRQRSAKPLCISSNLIGALVFGAGYFLVFMSFCVMVVFSSVLLRCVMTFDAWDFVCVFLYLLICCVGHKCCRRFILGVA